MDGQIKFERLSRSTFCERDMLYSCVKHKPEHMVASDFFFTSRNERSRQIEIKTWNRCGEENAWYLST